MRHVRTIQIPATTKQIIDKITCDICGANVNRGGLYEIDEVSVERRTGTIYPEGGAGTETKVDLCGECFESKLIPWLKAQGANPQTEDWEA